MHVSVREGPGYLVVRPEGHLGVRTAPALRDALLKALAEEPGGVVCDLREVTTESSGLTVLLVVAGEIDPWPACPLLLLTEDLSLRDRLHQLGLTRSMRLVASLEAVPEELGRRPQHLHAVLRLPPTLDAPAAVRTFVGRSLGRWGVQSRIEAASLVVDELVTNAVVHADTEVRVRVALADGRLRVSVGDRSDRVVGIVAAQPRSLADGHGRGLALVEAFTDAWGVLPRSGGGKVVWALWRHVDRAKPHRLVRVPRQLGGSGPG